MTTDRAAPKRKEDSDNSLGFETVQSYELTSATYKWLTWRQLRLLDWMNSPQHPTLPQDPAIIWRTAMWKVSDLVRLSGVAKVYTYVMCRRDLDELDRRKLVTQLTLGRWMVGDMFR